MILKRVFIVNGMIRVQIQGMDLKDDCCPEALREFNLMGAGINPETSKPIIKLEYEKNPNGSGVLFLDTDQEDLDRVMAMHKELKAREEVGLWHEGPDLMKTNPEGLRGDRPDFDPSDPSYHGSINTVK